MTPGLAFFYGGLVRQQNVLTIIMQNFVAMGLVTIIWVVWGFSLCFGKSGKLFGDPSSYAMLSNIEDAMAPSPASPSHVRLPHGPKLPRRKRRARARAPKQHRSAKTLAARLLVRDFSFASSAARTARASPPPFPNSRRFLPHMHGTRGLLACAPPSVTRVFLRRFAFFFSQNRRRKWRSPSLYADLPPNDDAPSPLRDTYAVFQGMFAVIAPALMTGAFADRMFTPYLIFIAGWVHLVYFPFCHSVWGGGFLAEWGVWDFAGGIVVHVSSGFSALAAVMAMPHRKKIEAELDTDPHNGSLSSRSAPPRCGSGGSGSTPDRRSTRAPSPRTVRSTPRSPRRARSSRG